MLDHVESSLVKSPFGNCDYLPLIDPVYPIPDILVNAFIHRPAYGGPVHCKYIQGVFLNKWHWGKVGCWLLSSSVITTFLVRGSVKQTFFEGGSVVYKPRPDNANRPAVFPSL